MIALLWVIVVVMDTILSANSAFNGDVAQTILLCFWVGVGLWRLEKIKEGDNDG